MVTAAHVLRDCGTCSTNYMRGAILFGGIGAGLGAGIGLAAAQGCGP